jgi:hypothetical protein
MTDKNADAARYPISGSTLEGGGDASMPSRLSGELETWVKIPGFSAYEVSDHGRVRRGMDRQLHPGQMRTVYVNPRGYMTVGLKSDAGHVTTQYVHRLVVSAFIGPVPSKKHHTAHFDGNKQNNHISNLRWATPSENAADSIRLGTLPIGINNANSVLTPEKVRKIRASKKCQAEVAREFGIAPNTVRQIKRWETWKHV